MANQILVPALGESITEATVAKWLKQVGEKVDSDESLVELETDKVNIEVPSPISGTLSTITVKEGDTVEVGALLGLLKEGKSGLSNKIQTQSTYQEQPSYTPTKTVNKSKKIRLRAHIPDANVDGYYTNAAATTDAPLSQQVIEVKLKFAKLIK